MALKDIYFHPSYSKTKHNVYRDFYKPCMENSIFYNRITGYFGSSVFLVLHKSLKTFILNGGKIKIICSPYLKDEDLNAIISGYKEKEETIISNYLNEIIDELSNNFPNSTLLLTKLISSGLLEIKLSVFGKGYEDNRLMHDKAGIFADKFNNLVAFRGSNNETFNGVSSEGNSESFDVFTSWEDGKDKQRVELIHEQFEKIWKNNEENIKTFDIPSLTIEKIKNLKTELKLDELIEKSKKELFFQKSKWFAENGENARTIKKHQELILNNWEKNNRRGLFQMCTGSGKTFTALCAIRDAIFEKNEVPIIIVPTKLLFKQWLKELKKVFNNDVAIALVGADNKMSKDKIQRYTKSNLKNKRCILTTYQSASKKEFVKNIRWGKHIFLVCDEVHNIGSSKNIGLLDVDAGPKIGLSATPKRYLDDESTKKIFSFFNGIINPKYTISEALKDNILTEYFYYFTQVELSLEEQEKWNFLTNKINKAISIQNNTEEIFDQKKIEKLLFKRADIIKKAEQKIDVAEKILLEKYKKEEKWLVYLDDYEHVKTLKKRLLKYNHLKGCVFEYHSKTESDLKQTINYFENNGAILLSINCLDEGVDIPSVSHAIILSSSKNPRQFIQRRGRVLRKHKNKNFAYIYDCLVLPNCLSINEDKSMSILRGEIIRLKNFAKDAKNWENAIGQLSIIMTKNNIKEIEGENGTE